MPQSSTFTILPIRPLRKPGSVDPRTRKPNESVDPRTCKNLLCGTPTHFTVRANLREAVK
jgi:hypothetical protein